MTHTNNLVPTSSPPRPRPGDDLRNRPRPSSPSLRGDEVELESDDHHTNNTPPRPRDEVTNQRTCRSCGCTDDHACSPPCWWVAADLCSACQPAPLMEPCS